MSSDDPTTPMTDDTKDAPVVVSPEADDTATTRNDSPIERMKRDLPSKLHRNFVAADDDHPLVQTAQSKEALLSNTPVEVQRILADDLYQDTEAFFREWAQNHIAACVREGKRRVKEHFGEDALYYEIDHSHPDLDGERVVRLPKSAFDILDMARDIGYNPIIEFEVNHDEGKLVTRDNGIGMTTAEVMDVWNEPAESGSGTDQSSAGNKGIGSLTWVTIAGEEGAMTVKTRTKRSETFTGEPVPQRDRDGFNFFTFFGGVVPIPGAVEDGFYGTEFDIPIESGLDPFQFKDMMAKYADILPVQITWYEVENGVTEDSEFEKQGIIEMYEEEPNIVYERPGEFSLILGRPDIVSKGSYDDDTWLLDNPIDRNVGYDERLNTLWNDHLVLHNEQGLIIEGPNRGYRTSQVDELAGDISDITDEDAPMPDIPLPEPVASRDNLARDEAHSRFFEFLKDRAVEMELSQVTEYLNGYLATDTIEDAFEYLREHGGEYDLFYKLAKQHGLTYSEKDPKKLHKWLKKEDMFDYDDERPEVERFPDEPERDETHQPYDRLPKWSHLKLLTSMDDDMSVYDSDSTGDPNQKGNRRTETLGEILLTQSYDATFLGASLNADRAKVVFENYDNPLLVKSNAYSTYTSEPYNWDLLKNVPFTKKAAEESEYDWDVPDGIDNKRSKGSGNGSSSQSAVKDVPLKIRTTENSAVDLRTTVGEMRAALNDTAFGEIIADSNLNLGQRYMVVFPTNGEYNISDYWHLTGHAALVRTKVKDTEALIQHPQVFTVDTFTRMLMDVTFDTFDPATGEWSTISAPEIVRPGDDTRYVFSSPAGDGALWALLTGQQHSELPNDAEAYERARSRMYQKLESSNAWASPYENGGRTNPEDWVLVNFDTDEALRKRALTYWDLYAPKAQYGNRGIQYQRNATYLYCSSWDHSETDHFSTVRFRYLDKILERADEPAWDWDSGAWDRVNDSYGPTSEEKAMWKAMRDIGIDPEEHTPEQLRAAINHLVARCPDGRDD